MPKNKKPITTKTGRAFKLAGMTASVAGRYAKTKLKKALRVDNEESQEEAMRNEYAKMADSIVDTLGDLKGAVMKVGQIASQTQDLLPKEISEALKKLQKEAPPVEFEVIRGQIESTFNTTLESLFIDFDETPYASASIGQVHRAKTLEGKEVVVKVQYPAVAKSVESDLGQLKLTLKLGGLLKLPKKSVDELFNEIKARLKEELDYINEAQNIEHFARFHEQHAGIKVPRVIHELSNEQVLTLEYMPGTSIAEIKDAGFSQDDINRVGELLFKLVAEQLFVFGEIHGDPHPGNFAVSDQGEVIVYDFGCVKKLRPEIVKAYKEAIRASINQDYTALDHALIGLGARVPNQASPGAEYYTVWRNILFEPFLENRPYDYQQSDIHLQAAKNTSLFFENIKRFRPPVESLYIDRMISGQFWIMKSMGVQADFRSLLEQYVDF